MLYLHAHYACATTNLAQLNSTQLLLVCLSLRPVRRILNRIIPPRSIRSLIDGRWMERWIDDDSQNGSAIAGTAASNNNIQHFLSSW
jgi:hypothetical protein